MLANHAEVVNGLAYISGGGIDTVNTPSLPAALMATLIVRVKLHRIEIGQPHTVEFRIISEDGAELLKGGGTLPPQQEQPAMPVGWDYTAMFANKFFGLKLPKEQQYSVEILADGNHLASLPFRVAKN